MWAYIIPWSLTFIGLTVSILTFARNGRRDSMRDKQEQDMKLEALKESLLKANLKLDQVCQVTTETRSDIKALNNSMAEIDKRVSVCENDLKTAFMRIDELRDIINNKGV